MVRVLALEPGREGARIATTDDDPIGLVTEPFVLALDELCYVSKRLFRSEPLKVVGRPVLEGLRVTVVTMFERVEKSTMLSANHHREHLVIRG